MKMRAVLCFVYLTIAVVAGSPNRKIFEVPKELVPDILKASADCADKLGLDALNILPQFFAGELKDSESVRQYMYCLGTTSGYMNDDGSLNKEKLGKAVGEHKNKVESVVEECNKAKYSDKYERVYNAVVCFRGNSGIQFKV